MSDKNYYHNIKINDMNVHQKYFCICFTNDIFAKRNLFIETPCPKNLFLQKESEIIFVHLIITF